MNGKVTVPEQNVLTGPTYEQQLIDSLRHRPVATTSQVQMDASIKGLAVYRAIAAITGELSKVGISKQRQNKQQGYAFRGIDDVYASLSGLLAQHRLCVIPRVISRSVTEQQSKSGGVLFYTVVDVEFDLVSAEDGSMHTARVCGEAMDSGDKSSNKSMSAAYKYFALQTFCIPTEGDNDTENQTHEVAPKRMVDEEVSRKAINIAAPPKDLSPLEQKQVSTVVDQMREVLERDIDEDAMCRAVLDLNDLLVTQHTLALEAWKLLSSKERSTWKKYVELGKMKERMEPPRMGHL
jgi:hypothetical protein